MRIAIHDYAGHPFQFELSRELARRGHTVRHFFFADDPGPKGDSGIAADDPADFSIAPISLGRPYYKEKFFRRSLADHQYGRLIFKHIVEFQPDCVVSGNTPLDAQRSVLRAARSCGAQFLFWIQDFYSLAIERSLFGRWAGLGSLVTNYYRRIETSLLRDSDGIVLISPDFTRYLPSSVAQRPTNHVIRNWGPLNSIWPVSKSNSWLSAQSFAGKFIFMYTGTLALKHNPELLLALSDTFADDPDVAIVVIASGVSADFLRMSTSRQPRANLTLLPLQPMRDMPDVLGSADVLMTILEDDAGEFSVPSKLLSYLCAGKPILLSAPSRNLATTVLTESGGGLHADASDKGGFVAAARQLRHDQRLRSSLGEASRAYALRHFDVGKIAMQFEHAMGAAYAQPERRLEAVDQ